MAHTVVKMLDEESDGLWHYSHENYSDVMSLCDNNYYGSGSGVDEYKTKEVKRGGITCAACIDVIKKIKEVKL